MRKFITLIITTIILAVSVISCGSKVEKDIKALVGNDIKVCDVKSIDIEEDFYQYTEEYNRFFEKNKEWSKDQIDWYAVKLKWENLFTGYPSAKERNKEEYDNVVKAYQKCVDSVSYYYNKCKALENENKVGKVYVAKMLGRNEITHKPNDYNSYSVFAYNSDGTIHPIETNSMKIIFSVFPKAKKDLQKVMGNALGELVDEI